MASLQSKESLRLLNDITNKKPSKVKKIESSDEEPSIEEASHMSESFQKSMSIEESDDQDETGHENRVITIESESDTSQSSEKVICIFY